MNEDLEKGMREGLARDTKEAAQMEAARLIDIPARTTQPTLGETELPVRNSLTVSGAMPLGKPLDIEQRVIVRVTTPDGELLCSGQAEIAVSAKPKHLDSGSYVERKHTAVITDW